MNQEWQGQQNYQRERAIIQKLMTMNDNGFLAFRQFGDLGTQADQFCMCFAILTVAD